MKTGTLISTILALSIACMGGEIVYDPGDVPSDIHISIKVGENERLSFRENPTTGYRWIAEYDNNHVEIYTSRTLQPDKHLVGAPSVITYVITPKHPGSHRVNMRYERPWETSKKPVAATTVVIDAAQ